MESLPGLPGVAVIVENLHDDAKTAGLTKETIQTVLELGLRRAGIRILTGIERLLTPGQPVLYAVVAVVTDPRGGHIYTLGLDLRQTVTVRGDIEVIASTWEVPPTVGLAADLRSAVRLRFLPAFFALLGFSFRALTTTLDRTCGARCVAVDPPQNSYYPASSQQSHFSVADNSVDLWQSGPCCKVASRRSAVAHAQYQAREELERKCQLHSAYETRFPSAPAGGASAQ